MATSSRRPDILGERQSNQDVRTQNMVAASSIVKSSLGPVGLDKMLVDGVGDVTITDVRNYQWTQSGQACKYVEETLAVKVEKLGKDSSVNCAAAFWCSPILNLVDAVQAVEMTDQRGEVKYPIKGMPLRVVPARIARLNFNLQKTKMQLGVQVLVMNSGEPEKIRQR